VDMQGGDAINVDALLAYWVVWPYGKGAGLHANPCLTAPCTRSVCTIAARSVSAALCRYAALMRQ
jgi:hypothetical protein